MGGSNYDAAGLWLGLRNQINYAVCNAIGVPPATAARGVQTFDTGDCQPIYSRFRLIDVSVGRAASSRVLLRRLRTKIAITFSWFSLPSSVKKETN